MFLRILTPILSFLLHHANRLGKDDAFYRIKRSLLLKYGKADGYDLQYISGRVCFSCDGSGEIRSWYDGEMEMCERCDGSGYYRKPFYVVLNRYRYGKYLFHSPEDRSYNKVPDDDTVARAVNRIYTYITHKPAERYAHLCKLLLFLFFNHSIFWQRALPYWFLNPAYVDFEMAKPKHIAMNIFHVLVWAIKTKGKHIPLFVSLIAIRNSKRNFVRLSKEYASSQDNDDLPF